MLAADTAASDMLMKQVDHNAGGNNVRFGESITDDQFADETFDYFLTNPPFGVFLLPQPPVLPPLAGEYRRLPGIEPGVESPELRLALRVMSQRREITMGLLEVHELVHIALATGQDKQSTIQETRSDTAGSTPRRS